MLAQHVIRTLFFHNQIDMRNSSSMSRYTIPVTALLGVEEGKGLNTFCLDRAQNTLNFGQSLLPSTTAQGILFHQILTYVS